MDSFQGDFSSLWKLQQRPPQNHLTWDWWWWLVMLDDPKNVEPGKQLMVLWSTKDNEMVQVNDVSWNPKGKPGFDEQGAQITSSLNISRHLAPCSLLEFLEELLLWQVSFSVKISS